MANVIAVIILVILVGSAVAYIINAKISGMHCRNCVNSVTRALNSIDGVAAKVSLRDSRADVLLDRMVDENDLRHAVEGAGFKVISIKSS